MKRIVPILIAYLIFMVVGATLSASTTPDSSPRLSMNPANGRPGATMMATDSLPQGRHQVSSYRNGSSTEFIVEDGEIKELKIDGKEIAPSEFPNYEERVEGMLGMKRTTMQNESYDYDVLLDYDNLNDDAERLEEYFERHGKKWERIGEEMAERIENMFEFDRDGSTFRFYFDGQGEDSVMEFNLDSIMMEHHPRLGEFDADELIEEMKISQQSARDEIDELETMIERMERRRDEAKARLDETESGKSLSYNGFNFETALKELRSDGLINPGVIRSFEFSQKELRINDEKVSDAAHERMLNDYRRRVNIGSKFTIGLDELNW